MTASELGQRCAARKEDCEDESILLCAEFASVNMTRLAQACMDVLGNKPVPSSTDRAQLNFDF